MATASPFYLCMLCSRVQLQHSLRDSGKSFWYFLRRERRSWPSIAGAYEPARHLGGKCGGRFSWASRFRSLDLLRQQLDFSMYETRCDQCSQARATCFEAASSGASSSSSRGNTGWAPPGIDDRKPRPRSQSESLLTYVHVTARRVNEECMVLAQVFANYHESGSDGSSDGGAPTVCQLVGTGGILIGITPGPPVAARSLRVTCMATNSAAISRWSTTRALLIFMEASEVPPIMLPQLILSRTDGRVLQIPSVYRQAS